MVGPDHGGLDHGGLGLAVGSGAVAVALGIGSSERAGVSILVGVLTVCRGVVAPGRRPQQRFSADLGADQLLRFFGDIVAASGGIVAQGGVVVSLISHPIPLIRHGVTAVGGLVALGPLSVLISHLYPSVPSARVL